MSDRVYKIVEVTGTSTTCIEDAIGAAIRHTHATAKNLRWFEVVEIRGDIKGGDVQHWQVTVKIGGNADE